MKHLQVKAIIFELQHPVDAGNSYALERAIKNLPSERILILTQRQADDWPLETSQSGRERE